MATNDPLKELFELIKDRKTNADVNSYTKRLFDSGLSRITQKVGEESVEVVIASLKQDKEEIINESTDLLYHLLVLLAETGVELDEIYQEIANRKTKTN